MRTIVWFRDRDLRVKDHEALWAASKAGAVIPLFVLDPFVFSPERVQEAPHHCQFLLDCLNDLELSLRQKGSRLIIAQGSPKEVLPRLARSLRADRVWAHRCSEPFIRECDQHIARSLGSGFRLFEGETLAHPSEVRTKTGGHYAVFTAFRRTFQKLLIPSPRRGPARLPALPDDLRIQSSSLPQWTQLGMPSNPTLLKGGERAARKRLVAFLSSSDTEAYDSLRDRMDLGATSRLSADLKFGTLSIREVWNRVTRKLDDSSAGVAFKNQLIWREFSHSILWNRPSVLDRPFKEDFLEFPYRFDETMWRAWTEGRTGYPIVDASARQLLNEGFVHNRARMVSASFLAKHLLIDYRLGEAHYMKYLVDGDAAQNNLGWQWAAGCGCDPQPYFRIFNPVRQGQRFDPKGAYVRSWIPELGNLPDRYVHHPWNAPRDILRTAGTELGRDYPYPIVDHAEARTQFLTLAREHLRARRSTADSGTGRPARP